MLSFNFFGFNFEKYRKAYISTRQLILFLLANLGFPLDNQVSTNVSTDYTDHIRFNLYYGPDPNDFVTLNFSDGLTFNKYSFFDSSYNTIVYFPGWGEKAKKFNLEPSVYTVATAFRTLENTNLIVMDYSEIITYKSWFESMYNSSVIGNALAQFFEQYIPYFQPKEKLHFIGHSLGAPIISNTARAYIKLGRPRFYRLTGLDPAIGYIGSPYYLKKGDGDFVDIVHTADGSGGLPYEYGDIDFFPNGGAVQPFCALNPSVFLCYHAMSWRYYAESVFRPKSFPGQKCFGKCQTNYPSCTCNASDVAYLGYYQDLSKSGSYYMKTNKNPPFGMGDQGLEFGTTVPPN